MVRTKEGWQAVVHLHKNHVVKRFKSYNELHKKAHPYYKSMGYSEKKIDKNAKKAFNDIQISVRIIKRSNAPKYLFGYPAFKGKNMMTQARAVPLSIKLSNLAKKGKIKESKVWIDRLIDTIIELWKYGIHEKTFKFHSAYGVLGKRVILIDLLEITDKEKIAKKQIMDKKWKNKIQMREIFNPRVYDHMLTQANKRLTVKNLEKNWGSLITS